MKKYFFIFTLMVALVSVHHLSNAQIDDPRKKKKQTEKDRLERFETVKRHTKRNKKGMTKAEIRRRKILDRQARRRYKISEKRRKTKGLTKAARRMTRSEKRRRKTLRRKLKRIN
ncbi:MAG TPA: hypothetical protein DCS93_07400 [Microscillaceae bacterium]|nr:hypothetical protein [Microscillaceae bacterium]